MVHSTPITATHSHIPLLQLHFQTEDLFIHVFCVNTASSDMHTLVHTLTEILERKKEQAYVNLHVLRNGQHISIQLTRVSVSMPVRGFS